MKKKAAPPAGSAGKRESVRPSSTSLLATDAETNGAHDTSVDGAVSTIRVLLVEDSPSDLMLIREMFGGTSDADFVLEHASRLADALQLVSERVYDVVLLDLGLPDSEGVGTFIQLHEKAPDVPIVVLTALEEPGVAERAITVGAEDYLLKKQIQTALIRNTVRYSVLRRRVRHAQEEQRQREAQSREIAGMDRLSTEAPTSVTAELYSGSALRIHAPQEYKAAVAEYFDLLNLALEQRVFRVETECSNRLRELGLQLGFLRSGPRDVVEIHTNALKKRLHDTPPEKALAYLEEGRVTVLELMGYLTSYYRSFYTASKGRDLKQ